MCYVLCSWFVVINTLQVLKCTYLVLMYIFSDAHNLLKYMHGMVILGGHASAETVNSSFRGKPYLITRLYSLKYKVTLCSACKSHVNFTLYLWKWHNTVPPTVNLPLTSGNLPLTSGNLPLISDLYPPLGYVECKRINIVHLVKSSVHSGYHT